MLLYRSIHVGRAGSTVAASEEFPAVALAVATLRPKHAFVSLLVVSITWRCGSTRPYMCTQRVFV